jgi:hypothetical protein
MSCCDVECAGASGCLQHRGLIDGLPQQRGEAVAKDRMIVHYQQFHAANIRQHPLSGKRLHCRLKT